MFVVDTDLTSFSSTWSQLIVNLRTSLRQDLKLPQLAEQCHKTMKVLCQTKLCDEDIRSIDGDDDDNNINNNSNIADDDDELHEQLDMHSIILSTDHLTLEPFLTAEQVISDIDFMLQDMTPDSGYCDDQSTADLLDFHSRQLDCVQNDCTKMKMQSIDSLNECIEELNRSIKDLSSILVEELAMRDELDYDKETKNTFISLVLNIQVGCT
jgi:hypothetical protein